MNDETIFHIVPTSDWQSSDDTYVPNSLTSDGFIHCSTRDQVPEVAAALFPGRSDLLLLEITCAAVPAVIRWEDCYDLGEQYPHIYGPLPRQAVKTVREYIPDPQGRFPVPG